MNIKQKKGGAVIISLIKYCFEPKGKINLFGTQKQA